MRYSTVGCRRALSERQLSRVDAWARQGLHSHYAARRLGVSETTVQRALKRHEVPYKTLPPPSRRTVPSHEMAPRGAPDSRDGA